jgi:hypothetical protein
MCLSFFLAKNLLGFWFLFFFFFLRLRAEGLEISLLSGALHFLL